MLSPAAGSHDVPWLLHDRIDDAVSVVTVYDADSGKWTTAIMGGPLGGWETTYRDDVDPAEQHAKAIEAARSATQTEGTSDAV